MSDEIMTLRYVIRFEDGLKKVFVIELDGETLDIRVDPPAEPPAWTELGYRQCPNCPLDPAAHSHCPVAVNLTEVITFLRDLISYTEVDVDVVTKARTYSAHTSLQAVAGSLMGIYMVTSGCPILNKMRPMVETHLPFATWQETVYRAVTMYLFAQYFIHKHGGEANWDLKGLGEFYDQVQRINSSFAERLLNIPLREGDASINAISILSSFATMASMTIQDGDLVHWEKIFVEHWG